VAEGVENEALLNKLRELNCDEAQGYFIAKPMPFDEFVEWRTRWNASI
jgi:EAL domain-containing protein (putative c-di-GMP-specific phosphodiesterase class I)